MLEEPIAKHLDPGLDDRETDEVSERLHASLVAHRIGVKPRRRVPVWALPAAAAALVLIAGAWAINRSAPDDVPAPLTLEGSDEVFSRAEAPDAASRRVHLSDGSRIELSGGTTLEAVENDGSRVSLVLGLGEGRFAVRPGGPRRWSIDAGLAHVDVVGTRFVVTRSTDTVRVSVEHGVVRVHGAFVDSGVRRLVAGQSVVVRRSGAEEASASATPDAPEPAAPTAEPEPEPAHAPASRSPAWRRLLARGDARGAYEGLVAQGLPNAIRDARDVATLWDIADAARRSGHPRDAVEPLSRILSEHSTDERAGLAGFTLGRIRLESLSQPGRAVEDFSRARDLGLPSALVDACEIRRIEALARARRLDEARTAATRFVAGGRTLPPRVQRLLDE